MDERNPNDVSSLFDSSAFDLSMIDSSSAIDDKEAFIDAIMPKLQAILDRRFPNNPQKRRIRVHRDRISFAAPCCGDSAHDNFKKRGNIILEGKYRNMYKCFNCGKYMSLHRFFSEYGEDLSLGEIDYIAKNKIDLSEYMNTVSSNSISYIYDTEDIDTLAVSRDDFKSMLGLVECSVRDSNAGRDYLMSRHQYNSEKFLYSAAYNKLFVLNLTPSGKIFGMQVRNLGARKGEPKYKTYSLQKIHEMILQDGVNIPDDINSLSMIFNILLIDCSRPVTILEGPMDSFLVKNGIALCGAGKNMDFPFMHRYMFDDDATGREHAIDKLREGNTVFLWDSLKRDLNYDGRGKLDMNDLVLWCSKRSIPVPSIDKYFTNDELDIAMI